MKKQSISIIILLSMLVFGISSSVSSTYQSNDNSLAQVDQVKGLYVFFAAKPVQEYTYLGTVKLGITWDSQTSTRVNAIIKKANKSYPNAQAIIFNEMDFGSADVIMFKE